MSNALEIQHLTKQFPSFCLQDVHLMLPTGYIMGLIGANGAGKTTTVRLILNMLRRDEGFIKIMGRDNLDDEVAVKKKVAVVFDSLPLVGEWKVATAVKNVAAFYPDWQPAAFASYLHRFHIDENKKVMDLSRGTQTKLSLAIALSRNAKLLILDEPTSGLDPVSRSEILDILAEYILDGKHSIFFSTHITTDLERVADFITFLQRGQVAFTGSKDDFLAAYYLIKGDPRRLSADLKQKFVGLRQYDGGFEGLITSEQAKYFKTDFLLEAPSIDDIMVYSEKGVEYDA